MSNTMMPPSTGPSYPPLQDGLQKARCYLMAYVGTQQTEFKGTISHKPQIVLGFIYPEHTYDFKGDGEKLPYSKAKTYTFNLGRKANLRRDLEAWRGKKWTEDFPNFDIAAVLGTAVLHNIIHSECGSKFYIENFIKADQKSVPPLNQPTVCYDIRKHDEDVFQSLPKWIQKMVTESQEWQHEHDGHQEVEQYYNPAADLDERIEAVNAEIAANASGIPTDDDDDLPF